MKPIVTLLRADLIQLQVASTGAPRPSPSPALGVRRAEFLGFPSYFEGDFKGHSL